MDDPTNCAAHGETVNTLATIAATVRRLEQTQATTASVQAEMATSLAVMANTLQKIEDTNIVIERLSGRLTAALDAFDKAEKSHDDIFNRLRKIEGIGCNARLNKLEIRQDKQLWGVIISIGLLIAGTIVKAVWK